MAAALERLAGVSLAEADLARHLVLRAAVMEEYFLLSRLAEGRA